MNREQIEACYMRRCFQLAANGLGAVAPNPMVGAVIVCEGKIIGEGYHRIYGEAHAEVNAIASVDNKELLHHSTMYVNLEPCSHFGKTPPCSDLIIEMGIPRVVIANIDPNPKVAGRGVQKMRKAGIDVTTGFLEEEGIWLNRRFFTFQTKHRPYVQLKWAQSADGFLDRPRENNCDVPPVQISSKFTKMLVHKARTEESAIMVGTNTAIKDNPKLTARRWEGNNPVRVVVDRQLRIPAHYNLFDQTIPTLVYTEQKSSHKPNLSFIHINFAENPIQQIMDDLYKRNILSIIVEGGQLLLNAFITAGIWDEAKIETAPLWLGDGVKAPQLDGSVVNTEIYDKIQILTINPNSNL
ncbi:MAG: bifunctional diaminohydroxyphosphoribosylaminopyrimidine deaminase/5-amino-6-(5-phosphoribosylamino)uracil reductase RibD [Bacteroidota bacterium]|nr:bifunctional diaminohydroxyphosphoribosylaminopyrimidine deaminase/5-amino-6-(5-phosphoribosylamino)uracil reductase RibD [Bacteroidota bacterium]